MYQKISLLCFALVALLFFGCAPHHMEGAPEGGAHFNPLFFPPPSPPEVAPAKPFLGIYMKEAPEEYYSETVNEGNAVYVDHVMAETAAEKAGLLTGDIIIAVDGVTLDDSKEETRPARVFKERITTHKIGDPLTLSLVRETKLIEAHATIGGKVTVPPPLNPHTRIDAAQERFDEGDSLLATSLAIKDETLLEEFTATLQSLWEKSYLTDSYKVGPPSPFRLREVSYLLQNPTNIIPLSREISYSLTTRTAHPGDLVEAAARQLDVSLSPERGETPHFATVDDVIAYIIDGATRATRYRHAAFREVSDDEMSFLHEESLSILADDDSSPEGEERLVKLLRIAAKIDFTALFSALREASRCVAPGVIDALHKAGRSNPIFLTNRATTAGAGGDVVKVIETELGDIIVGGTGPTYYEEDAFVIIDFGGNDIYENNGGASTAEFPISIVIDLAGNDTYVAGRDISQGTGFAGIGILADRGGNDTYIAEFFTQGAGIFGGGMLIDRGGDDIYRSDSYGNGAAIFGIGILIDDRGNDRYEASQSSQGFASTKGLGALIDKAGHDSYYAGGKYPDHRNPEHATGSLSQGFSIGMRPYKSPVGASGGIGLLIDEGGDDRYSADYFAQGSSYWYSLGLLHDLTGDDTYIGGRYAQGAGIHVSSGALIDERGNDSYAVTYGVSQGVGHDFGVGMVADFSGHDRYKGGVLSQGASTCGSLGILYDRHGENSLFRSTRENGLKQNREDCENKGFGIVIDTNGSHLTSTDESSPLK